MKRTFFTLFLITSITRIYSQCDYALVWDGFGLDHMNIYVMNATIDGVSLQAGDQVAVFDGPYCVGKATVSGSGSISVVASKDDPVTPGIVDGFREGNTMSFRICDASSGSEVDDISVTLNGGSLAFEASGSAFVTLAGTTCQSPAKPAAIAGRLDICKNETVTYSVAPVPGATSYTWTLPSGWTGSSNTNSITAKAGASGTISVTANNNCGSGAASTLDVAVHVAPAQPGLIKGNTEMCEGSVQSYCIETVNGATAYSWSFPEDWTGNSLYNSVSVTAGKQSGDVSVSATNFCGASPARTIHAEVTALPCNAGEISGDLTVCEGVTQTYSIGAVNGATSYSWTLPEGWTGTSSTNSITVTPGANGGSISVKADNECGSGSPKSMAVDVAPVPAQPSAIQGETEVCEGATSTFSITESAGATSYSWILPDGWTGSSTTNTIDAVAGSGGIISVKANGLCGSSEFVTKEVTVLNMITAPVIDSIIHPDCQVPNGSAYLSGLPATGTWMLTVNELSTEVESKPVLTSLKYTTGTIVTGTGTTTIINGLEPGKYSFTVYSETGCSSAESESVTIGMAPSIPSSPVIGGITQPNCEHNFGSITITGLPAGNWTITCDPVQELIRGTGSEITIDSVYPGSYVFKVTSEAGCISDESETATVDPQPQSPSAAVVSQQDNVLHSDAPEGNQWYGPDGAITGATGQEYTPSVSGNYYVIVTVDGCTSPVSNTISFVIIITGIQDPDASIALYPNPVDNEMVVEPGNMAQMLNYEILDLTGKVVLHGQIQGKSVIKTGMLSNGVYLFKINVDGKGMMKKIIKQ